MSNHRIQDHLHSVLGCGRWVAARGLSIVEHLSAGSLEFVQPHIEATLIGWLAINRNSPISEYRDLRYRRRRDRR
jgi:hypothetical protein